MILLFIVSYHHIFYISEELNEKLCTRQLTLYLHCYISEAKLGMHDTEQQQPE